MTAEPGNDVEGFRTSPQQRHVWQLQGGGAQAAFVVGCVVHVEGELSAAPLRAALETVVARHEILRTGLQCLPGTSVPVQVIADHGTATLEPVELESEGSLTSHLADLVARARERVAAAGPSAAPGLHVTWVSVGKGHLLVLALPATCADAIGLTNLVQEIARAYAAGQSGAELDDEPMQYADLAEWQNELLDEAEPVAVMQFVPHHGEPELPRHNGRADGFSPDSVAMMLGDESSAAVAAAAAERGVSESTFLLACWQVLLHRMTGQEDIVLGVVCDGRGYEGLEDALGLLERDLPLSAHIAADTPFEQVLQSTAKALGEVLDNQESFSWDRVGTSGQDDDEPPYFRVAFGYEDRGSFEKAGLRFALRERFGCTQRSDVRLLCARGAEGLVAELHFDLARHDRDEVGQWLGSYRSLVESVLRDDSTAVAELEILDAEAAESLRREFNRPPVDVDTARRIHALIEQHADQQPDALAAVTASERLSYGELERRANQLANHLRQLGVAPDQLVGLCLQRSTDMVVGMVGILKAGAAYLPLDPGYPAERLAFMLEDSGAPVLVTRQDLGVELPEHGAKLVHLDADADAIAAAGDARPETAVEPDHMCYVIYTSGSTGRPKGVEITHRGLVHSTTAREDTYDVAPGPYLLLSSFAFDSSIAGIFWTLCSGGTLVLPGDGDERDLHAITSLIEQYAVTHTLALPSLYALLLRETRPEQLASLRCIIVAGEACPRDLVEQHGELMPGAALYNEYGPTEGTVWSTVLRCRPGAPDQRVSIGSPIRNVQIHILDSRMRSVPVGVPGEMYIGGAGLARGYLGRPELTAERFVENPFGEGRLYRTGDLARYRADGEIDFLGRVDHQVKIRGYRVELEEIEEALRRDPTVQDAAVLAREDTPGDLRLVGYVSPSGGAEPEITALQDMLRAALPEYMVPAAFVVLDTLPLSPNGKVDRKALPAPDPAATEARPDYVAPRNAVESVLAEIWGEVLGVEDIGAKDNFFQLGGHSLLVTQMVFRLRDTLGVELPLRTVFEAPTLGDLTDVVFADPQRKARAEKAAALLTELADMSDDDVEAMLRAKTGESKKP